MSHYLYSIPWCWTLLWHAKSPLLSVLFISYRTFHVYQLFSCNYVRLLLDLSVAPSRRASLRSACTMHCLTFNSLSTFASDRDFNVNALHLILEHTVRYEPWCLKRQ
jgi:hypothetical protein